MKLKIAKKMRIGTVVLSICVLIICSFGSAYAAVTMEPINAFFNRSVSFVMNGELWQPKDANGKTIAAINYKGTNYLPVRAVSEALKIPIEYDGATQRIYIGQILGARAPIFSLPIEIDDVYAIRSKDPVETLVKSKQYKEVLKIDQYGDVLFKIDRKYKWLVLDVAVIEPGEHEVEFSLYNASEVAGRSEASTVLEMHKADPEDGVKQLKFNVEGLEKIRIHVQSHNLNPYIYARILDSSYFDN